MRRRDPNADRTASPLGDRAGDLDPHVFDASHPKTGRDPVDRTGEGFETHHRA